MDETEGHTVIRHLKIGYLGTDHSWEQLLTQSGTDWTRIHTTTSVDVTKYSTVIAGRRVSHNEKADIEKYLSRGGALLDTTGQFATRPTTHRRLDTVEPDSFLSHIGRIDVHGTVNVVGSGGLLNGMTWFDPDPGRNYAFFGLPVRQLWKDYRTVHRPFGVSKGNLTAERTALRSSTPYLQLLLDTLNKLHNQADLPFVHRWWSPDVHRRAATFRIDTDYSSVKQLSAVSRSAIDYAIPLTWFLHTHHHRNDLSTIKNMIPEHDEVALHGYRHYEYSTKEQYRSDIHTAFDHLREGGFHPAGYAAPYGHWSEALASALCEFPFRYSSEFSYDFDALPSTPEATGIRQLPVHPVSLGSFRRFGSSPEQGVRYFRELLKEFEFKKHPVHLYHHPRDATADQLANLFDAATSDELHWMSYTVWADWWAIRCRTDFSPVFDTQKNRLIFSDTCRNACPIAIHTGDLFCLTTDSEADLEEQTFHPYINPELKSWNAEQMNQPRLTYFQLLKDRWMTHLWRNRA